MMVVEMESEAAAMEFARTIRYTKRAYFERSRGQTLPQSRAIAIDSPWAEL